jgi:hypothetical protein
MKQNPPLDSIVEVMFYDHCQGSNHLMPTKVWGRLVAKDRISLVVRVWGADGEDNCEVYAIDRRTVEGIAVLTVSGGQKRKDAPNTYRLMREVIDTANRVLR